jgi:peptide deformylase
MIKDLVQYPQIPSKEFNAPVRHFDDELKNLIQDLKDTIAKNNLQGLSAFQINNPYNVIVVKDNKNKYLTIINPKIYHKKDKITSEEQTTYFGEITAKITRDKKIKIVYDDENGQVKYLNASDDFAILLQRKIDYTFGGNIKLRLNEKDQNEFDLKLEYGDKHIANSNCKTSFLKDKIGIFTKYLIVLSIFILPCTIFLNDKNDLLLKTFENYSMGVIFISIIFYLLYGYYESKKNKGCSTCQIGNLFGTAVINSIKLIVLFILNIIIF